MHLPFSGLRSTGSAAPDQRHRMPNVWQTARSAASSLARIASKSRKAGSSQAGFSRTPWANAATPSFCRGSMWPGPPVPTYRE